MNAGFEPSPYSLEQPLFLVTDFPPDAGGGGAVILRSLISPTDRARIIWASPSLRPDTGRREGELPLADGSHRFSRWLRRRSVTVDSLAAASLADEIAREARRSNARALWIVMHGAMVHVAARLLSRHPSIPVHLTVHDDPPFGVSLLSRRHLMLVPLVLRDFRAALAHAASVDVVSEGMAARYRSVYGIQPVVVHRGLAGPIRPSPTYDRATGLEVGILGNTYGYGQVLAVAQAVERASALARTPGRVVVVGAGHGARLKSDMRGRLEVEVTGHLDENAAIDRLRRSFLLYLNYPFSRRTSVLRQTSFPTKLTTYVMTARPLLAHAPADASIAPLFQIGDYVSHWASMKIDDGADAILRAWQTEELHRSRDAVAERIRAQFYDLAANRERLWNQLNALPSPSPEVRMPALQRGSL
jgi:hypothetical protein